MPAAAIPAALRDVVTGVWGAEGRRWLADLPRLVADLSDAWALTLRPLYPPSMHWVCAVTCADGTPAVLKLGPPGDGHLRDEAAALDAFGGHGAVRLLRHDPVRGALLLERAEPGVPASMLVPGRDDTATDAAVAVLHRLHRPAPDGCRLPPLRTRGRAFDAHLARYPGDRPLPRRLVEAARTVFAQLCDSATASVVLHGDLHHDNVLAATRAPWLAVDPHGVVGDPGYDVGALLYNPRPDDRDPALLALVPARIDQLADGLAMPRDRVVAWAYVQAVLAEVWTAEQGPDVVPGRALDVARALLPELP